MKYSKKNCNMQFWKGDNMGLIIGGVILGLIILLVVWAIGAYNKLVKSREFARKAWQDIDVQLQRRFDLLPNLVNTVKGYMKHEEKTLTDIAKYRGLYNEAGSVAEKGEVVSEMNSALGRLMVSVEAYPELKANENFTQLQTELSDTENKISYTRQFYNDAVTKYNLLRQQIPTNIIAGMGNFEAMELFKIDSEEAKKAPNVDFNA